MFVETNLGIRESQGADDRRDLGGRRPWSVRRSSPVTCRPASPSGKRCALSRERLPRPVLRRRSAAAQPIPRLGGMVLPVLPWASGERLGALLETAAVATCRWRPPFEKLSFSRAEVGRARGQLVLDGRADSTVVSTGTRRGLECSGFLTWTSSAPLA